MESVVFRLCEKAPDILREVCLERGWEEYNEDGVEADGNWNLWWKTQGFTSGEFEHCRPWQRLNHFPKSTHITKKDGLARNLRRMRTSYGGSMFEFFPLTFILPNEYKKFVAEFSKQDGGQQSNYWICKPTEQSCGRGIFIFQDLHDLTYDCAVVVQKYIIKPFLISGYKFDLRLYAIVTSFHPFQLYIYHEGLVRFSTERFDLSSLDNRFSHLTNTSINKTGPQYSAEKESIGTGCKWTLGKLRHYLHKHSIDDRLLWHRVTSIIIITLLSQVQEIPSNSSNCFELFGFDILIDEKLKPWLLEVNFSPALGNDCNQDELVKKPLLNDILEALNFTEVDIKRGKKEKVNNDTRKKGLKVRDTGKSTYPRPGGKQKYKSNFNIFPLQSESECIQVAERVKNPGSGERKLGDKNASKHQREIVGANGIKGKKSVSRCKTPSSKFNLLNQKRLSTSEEFLKAAKIDCDSQAELNDSKVPLNCTKEDNLAVKNNPDTILGAAEGQSLLSDQTKVDKGGKRTDYEREEQTLSLQNISRSESQSGSSRHSLQTKNSNNHGKLPSHLRLRRYKSEASFLHSVQSVHKYGLPNSSTEALHRIPSRYATRISTASTCRQDTKNANNTLKLQPQIGNCILAFPFNEVTLKASLGKLDQKVVVEEIRKILKATSSHIRSSSTHASDDETKSCDLSKPFWGYRSKLNSFYSCL